MKAPGVEVAHLTDIGRKRKHNEDAFGFFSLSEDEVLAIVADRMGGHASGELASRMAMEIIQEVYSKERMEQDVLEALKSAFEVANFTILQKSLEQEDLNGMGTTETALVIKGDETFVGHMGDSRAYLLRNATAHQLTRDHSIVNRMVEQGLLSKRSPKPSSTECHLQDPGGNRDADLDLIGPLSAQGDDISLLCSDGLINLVSDEELLKIIKKESPEKACETLIQLANNRGGHDNITIQILKVLNQRGE